MKLLLAFATFVGAASAAPISEYDAGRLADAIYAVEGKDKAKVPYGVLSVRTRSPEHAREICLRTIRNNWDRWEAAGKPGDFIEFLGKRYCPVEGDKTGLNKNWLPNVRSRLHRGR